MNEFEVSQSTDNRLTISLIVMTAAMLLELFSRHFYDIYQGGAMMELLAQVVKTDGFLTAMSIIALCAQVYITGCLWRAFRSKGHWAQWACLVMMIAPVAIMLLSWTTDEESVMQNMENPDISSQQIISAHRVPAAVRTGSADLSAGELCHVVWHSFLPLCQHAQRHPLQPAGIPAHADTFCLSTAHDEGCARPPLIARSL